MIRLDGKVAIVTGAGQGLGRAYAIALARAGAKLVINDLGVQLDGSAPGNDTAGLVVAEIRRAGGQAIANVDSVTDPAGVQRLFEAGLAVFHRLDILVNNAGIVRGRPLAEMALDDWQAVLDVHLTGTFLCSREALRIMRAAGRGGRIINTTSGAAFADAYPGTANYAAAKAGVIALTRVCAVEAKGDGVTCNAIAPLARTRMSQQFLQGASDPNLEPDAVAPLVVFLGSEAAAAISGTVFRIARDELAAVQTAGLPTIRPRAGRWTAEEIAARIGEILVLRGDNSERSEDK
jgi:NAD(P)-dependent dehydrogenase (short-subunit alcohol dehydrogenase family)